MGNFVSMGSHKFLSQSSWSVGTPASTMNRPAETLRGACSSVQKLQPCRNCSPDTTIFIWTETICFYFFPLPLPKSQCTIFLFFYLVHFTVRPIYCFSSFWGKQLHQHTTQIWKKRESRAMWHRNKLEDKGRQSMRASNDCDHNKCFYERAAETSHEHKKRN